MNKQKNERTKMHGREFQLSKNEADSNNFVVGKIVGQFQLSAKTEIV